MKNKVLEKFSYDSPTLVLMQTAVCSLGLWHIHRLYSRSAAI